MCRFQSKASRRCRPGRRRQKENHKESNRGMMDLSIKQCAVAKRRAATWQRICRSTVRLQTAQRFRGGHVEAQLSSVEFSIRVR